MSRSVTPSHDSLCSDDEYDDDDAEALELNSSNRSKNSTSKSNSRFSNYTPPRQSRQKDSRNSHENEQKKKWVDLPTKNSLPPSDFTVTHINQTYDYLVRQLNN